MTERYSCDRCSVPTRSVFEGATQGPAYPMQLDGGLHLTAAGYYGGFWDTMPFMGDEPVSFHLCHDCSAWLCREIPKMAERAEGGHFSSNVQDEGVLHSEHRSTAVERCCEWGVIVDEREEQG